MAWMRKWLGLQCIAIWQPSTGSLVLAQHWANEPVCSPGEVACVTSYSFLHAKFRLGNFLLEVMQVDDYTKQQGNCSTHRSRAVTLVLLGMNSIIAAVLNMAFQMLSNMDQ
jgi:hypothetical protein